MEEQRNIIRIGVVSAVNAGAKQARVHFPQFDNMVSGWLPVLQFPLALTADTAEEHTHTITSQGWMPRVNNRVVVAYEPGFSKDGYILGVIA